jgi:hypothetical protein
MPQFLPGGIDRILDGQHISAFSGEDMNCPICAKHSIVLVRYLDIGHILASDRARQVAAGLPREQPLPVADRRTVQERRAGCL